jgi:hypothetical protein
LTLTANYPIIRAMSRKFTAYLIILIIALLASPAWPQNRNAFKQPGAYDESSFFILLGYLQGPHFDEFVDWANEFYSENFNSTDSIGDFKGTVDFSLGLRVRFSRHFALEVDFMTATKRISEIFNGYDSTAARHFAHDLELNVVAVSASVPVIFQFSQNQRIVPFIAGGISIFPMRLDHSVDYFIRHTKTALAANFGIGLDTKIMPKTWITLRGDWTYGKTNMPVSQVIGGPDHFEMDLNTAQFHIGIMHTFR